jgi:H+-transporting ATPase
MGIAVSSATDVAKAAAGIVLTDPGLGGIVTCIREGRSAFQRVRTYTLSILVNKCATLIVLGAGLVMTGHAVVTPLLQAIAMLAGDFVTMSRAADRVRPSPHPNAWRIRNLTLAAIPLGLFKLSYYVGVLAVGWFIVGLDPGGMRTLTLLMLVFAGQATVYVLREQGHFWSSRPAAIMLLASSADLAIVASLAISGLLMTPLSPEIVGILAIATLAFALALDFVKIAVFSRLRIDSQDEDRCRERPAKCDAAWRSAANRCRGGWFGRGQPRRRPCLVAGGWPPRVRDRPRQCPEPADARRVGHFRSHDSRGRSAACRTAVPGRPAQSDNALS